MNEGFSQKPIPKPKFERTIDAELRHDRLAASHQSIEEPNGHGGVTAQDEARHERLRAAHDLINESESVEGEVSLSAEEERHKRLKDSHDSIPQE